MDSNQLTPQVSPILPTTQIRDITWNQTHRLLDRLLQELDDENTELVSLENMFKELSVKSNVDYKLWSNKEMSVSLDDGNVIKNDQPQYNEPDLLNQLNKQNKITDGNEDVLYNSRRTLILSLLHREKKLTRHYESLISAYENLITYTALNIRERREQTYGLYTNDTYDIIDKDSSVNKNQKPMKSIQSIQISRSLKLKAGDLKRNSELLKSLANQKRKEIQIVKDLVIAEAEQLANVLEREEEEENGIDNDKKNIGFSNNQSDIK